MTDKTNLIDVLIIADSRGEALMPLTQKTCLAMLPICGKPILEHILEALIPVPTRQIHILISGYSGQIRKFTGEGERWGLNIKTSSTRGNTTAENCLERLGESGAPQTLVIDTRYFTVISMAELIKQFSRENDPSLHGIHKKKSTGLYFFQRDNRDSNSTVKPGLDDRKTSQDVHVFPEHSFHIESLESYHKVNLTIAQYSSRHLILKGKETHPGIVSGTASQVEPYNLESGKILAGRNCQLHDTVTCSGTVVLGDNVVVDHNTTIVDSLVLNNSYIGEHLQIDNAIVWENNLIRVDRGTAVTLQDDQLLGKLSKTAFSSRLDNLCGRIFACIVLFLSLPLWIVALADARLAQRNPMTKRYTFVGNSISSYKGHQTVECIEILSRYRLLRRLPLLLALIDGRLKWFGVAPLTSDNLINRTETWEYVRDEYPVGLFGPAQFETDQQSSVADVLMSDATFPAFSRIQLIVYQIKGFSEKPYEVMPLSKVSSR